MRRSHETPLRAGSVAAFGKTPLISSPQPPTDHPRSEVASSSEDQPPFSPKPPTRRAVPPTPTPSLITAPMLATGVRRCWRLVCPWANRLTLALCTAGLPPARPGGIPQWQQVPLLEILLAQVSHLVVCLDGQPPAPETCAQNHRVAADDWLPRVIVQSCLAEQGREAHPPRESLIPQDALRHFRRGKASLLLPTFQFAEHRAEIILNRKDHRPCVSATRQRCGHAPHDEHGNQRADDLPFIHGMAERQSEQ